MRNLFSSLSCKGSFRQVFILKHGVPRKAVVGVILALVVLSIALLPASEPVYAWKPLTHIYTGNLAIAEILDWKDQITIITDDEPKTYPVDPRVAEAIRAFPDYYRGGTVGPDGFITNVIAHNQNDVGRILLLGKNGRY